MKKKLLTGIMIAIPVILIAIVIMFRAFVSPSNEEIIQSLKDTQCYKSKVEFTFINDRGEEKEDTELYFDKNRGCKIVFPDNTEKIFKDGKIISKNKSTNKEYTLDENLHDLHSIAILNELLSYPINQDSIKEGQEEWGEKIYLYFTIELFDNNKHVNTGKVYIDKENKVPIGVVIFNKEGKATVKIVYNQFEVLKKLDESLL